MSNTHRRSSVKNRALNIFGNFTGKHCVEVTLKKETPTQVFSCVICEIFTKIYYEEHLRMTASDDEFF